MPKKKHPNADIDDAIGYAESEGWTVKTSGSSSHAWGILYCPYNDSECRCGEFCTSSIWSTPRNTRNHAKQIRRIVDKCKHQALEG